MLDSWQDQIVDSFLRMTEKSSPDVRAEIIARVTAAFAPQSALDKGASPDMVPTQGSAVSVIRREFGRVVLTERERADQESVHPHERKEPPDRIPKRLPFGEPL